MGTPLRVALLVESSHAYGRKALQGIAAYALTHGPWVFHYEERAFDEVAPSGLKEWKPEAIIARISTPHLVRQLQRLRVPIVDLYEQHKTSRNARVLVDGEATIRLAVDHLRECGFQHLAFTGFPDVVFSENRARCFRDYVTALGGMPHLYIPPSRRRPRTLAAIETAALHDADALRCWLRQLPKPAGLLACNDMRAHHVLTVCADAGIEVPDMLGVIGIDNDEVRCSLSAPTLTSVDPNAFRVGYEAAALIHRTIVKRRRTPECVVVQPTGIVARRSTDVFACTDPEIAESVRFIREHACQGLAMGNVLNHARLSRATLERQYRAHLGRTPRAEITRVQVQRVLELLTTTDLPLKQIARRAGFKHVETMHRIVKKAIGQTPSEYRRTISRGRAMIAE